MRYFRKGMPKGKNRYSWETDPIEYELYKDPDAKQNHCEEVCNLINKLHRSFAFKAVTEDNNHAFSSRYFHIGNGDQQDIRIYYYGRYYNRYNESYHFTYKFDKAFEKTETALTENINNEVTFLIKQPDYSRMQNSKLLKDIRASIISILSGKATYNYDSGSITNKGVTNQVVTVDSVLCSCFYNRNETDVHGDGEKSGFHFILVENDPYYDSDYGAYNYNYIELTSGNYRKLSPLEISLLAVVLQKEFPTLFTVEWDYYISEKSELKWLLVPKWIRRIKPEPKPEPPPKLNDIY